MPDGSRHPAAPPAAPALDEAAVGGIVRDPIDVRDRSYEPTLAPLAPFRLPSDELIGGAARPGLALGPAAARRATKAPAAGRRWRR